jgi:hypothetical protein
MYIAPTTTGDLRKNPGLAFSLPETELQFITSERNHVQYKLYVGLPQNFDQSKSYPHIFLLDADYSFPIARSITKHLIERNELEEVVLIGIAYAGESNYKLNRTRDYTPSFSLVGGYSVEHQKHSGGGPQFAQFIEKELLPFVNAQYGLPKSLTLVGHSYGGLFCLWMSLSHQGVFDKYISISPSLWYDDHIVMKMEKELAQEKRIPRGTAFFGVGSIEVNMEKDLMELRKQMSDRSHENFKMRFTVLEDETHNTVFPSAFSKGLRFVMGLR